jgi:hypothetical protein
MCIRVCVLGTREILNLVFSNAADNSGELAAKTFVGRDIQVIQDVAQVLVVAAVQVGLNPMGNPGGEVSGFGPAHLFLEGMSLHPAIDPVVIHIATRASG